MRSRACATGVRWTGHGAIVRGTYAIAMVDIDTSSPSTIPMAMRPAMSCCAKSPRACAVIPGAAPYRYGGEEFCIVFEDAAVERADDLLESVRAAIEARAIRIRPIGRDGKPGKPKDVKVTTPASVWPTVRKSARRRRT